VAAPTRTLAVPPSRRCPLSQPAGAMVAGPPAAAQRPTAAELLARARAMLAEINTLPPTLRARRSADVAELEHWIAVAERAEEGRA